jgi:VanZ family protein
VKPIDLWRPWRGPFSASQTERVLRSLPAILYMAMIFLMSATPGEQVPVVIDDRVGHFVLYFGLGVMLMFAAAGFSGEGMTLRHVAGAFVVAAIFAVTDEWHQSFVHGRDSSLRDLLFDFLGAGSAQVLLWSFAGAPSR